MIMMHTTKETIRAKFYKEFLSQVTKTCQALFLALNIMSKICHVQHFPSALILLVLDMWKI